MEFTGTRISGLEAESFDFRYSWLLTLTSFGDSIYLFTVWSSTLTDTLFQFYKNKLYKNTQVKNNHQAEETCLILLLRLRCTCIQRFVRI